MITHLQRVGLVLSTVALASCLVGSRATAPAIAQGPTRPSLLHLPIVARSALADVALPATMGGKIGALVSNGRHVFALRGGRLTVVDPGQTGDYWLVGESGPLSVPVARLEVLDGMAYGAVPIGASSQDPMHGSPAGLAILDVHASWQPRIASFLKGADCVDVALVPPTAWLACGILWGVDVSSPTAPRETARVHSASTGRTGAVDWDGRYLYTAGWIEDQGRGIVQVMSLDGSGPPRPVGAVTFATERTTWSQRSDRLARRGHFLYVANGLTRVVQIVDLAVPTQPAVVDSLDVGGELWALEAIDDHLVAVTGDPRSATSGQPIQFELRVWSLANPARPAATGNVSLMDWPGFLAAHRGDALVASGADLLHVPLGQPGPLRAEPAGPTGGLAVPDEVTLTGNRLYVRDGDRVRRYDVFDPGRPAELAHYDAAGDQPATTRMAATDDTLYLVRGRQVVDIVTMTGAAAPDRVAQVAAETLLRAVAVDGQTLYLADTTAFEEGAPAQGTIRILDVTDPAAPRPLARIDSLATALAAEANRLALAEVCGNRSCIAVYDVTDPAAPRRLGVSGPVPGPPRGEPDPDRWWLTRLALSGQIVIAENWKIDFTRPEAPLIAGQYTGEYCFLCSPTGAIVAEGAGTVAIANANYVGLKGLLDRPDGADGYDAARYRLPEGAGVGDLATDGRAIYLATSAGLWVIGVAPSPEEQVPIPDTRRG